MRLQHPHRQRRDQLRPHDRPELQVAPACSAHGWQVETVEMGSMESAVAAADVLVDALLGTGSTGAPRDPYDRLIRAMNASGRPVVALDGPSGIDFATGAAAGEAVRADVTVT